MNEVDGGERVENTSPAASHPLSTPPLCYDTRMALVWRSYGPICAHIHSYALICARVALEELTRKPKSQGNLDHCELPAARSYKRDSRTRTHPPTNMIRHAPIGRPSWSRGTVER